MYGTYGLSYRSFTDVQDLVFLQVCLIRFTLINGKTCRREPS